MNLMILMRRWVKNRPSSVLIIIKHLDNQHVQGIGPSEQVSDQGIRPSEQVSDKGIGPSEQVSDDYG